MALVLGNAPFPLVDVFVTVPKTVIMHNILLTLSKCI